MTLQPLKRLLPWLGWAFALLFGVLLLLSTQIDSQRARVPFVGDITPPPAAFETLTFDRIPDRDAPAEVYLPYGVYRFSIGNILPDFNAGSGMPWQVIITLVDGVCGITGWQWGQPPSPSMQDTGILFYGVREGNTFDFNSFGCTVRVGGYSPMPGAEYPVPLTIERVGGTAQIAYMIEGVDYSSPYFSSPQGQQVREHDERHTASLKGGLWHGSCCCAACAAACRPSTTAGHGPRFGTTRVQ